MSEKEIRDTVGFLIIQIAKLHRQHISVDFSKMGIFAGQDMILRLLWEEDGLTQKQIINKLKVEPPTITKMIHRMEKTGLLERKRDLKDARVSRVFLTDNGRQLQTPILQSWHDIEGRLLNEVSDEDRELLKKLLTRLQRNLF